MTEPLFFEDVVPGMTFTTSKRTVVEADLLAFADVSGDRHPLHVDAAYAAKTEFGQRVAHGPFGIAMAIGLFGTLTQFRETAPVMTAIENWRFRAPIFIGDTIHLKMRIGEKSLTRSGRGLVNRHFTLVREDGSIPQEGDSPMIMIKRGV